MTASKFEVTSYSVTALQNLLDEHSHNGVGTCAAKSHLGYLDGYLCDVGAKTILAESPYTDRDYLEDYAAYYARCHEEYGRRCARLHFFGRKFEDNLIKRAMAKDVKAVGELQDSYLGFIVVKPLPSTVIGRTCLVTYTRSERERAYPATRVYDVHLFGIELKVDSLPFQEQDRDVAACATSALWSVFNATGHLFQHSIPSPAEITKAAAEAQRVMSRTLPAGSGLTAEQIADAIRSVGLEPGYINASNIDLLMIAATAYLRAGIPSILLGALVDVESPAKPKELGLHAVALAGYRLFTGKPSAYGTALFSATSSDKLYAHDDQIGPFSRLKVDRRKHPNWLHSSLREDRYFEPRTLLLPLYHKIRVPIDSVISAVASLNDWVELARTKGFVKLDKPVVWDIELTSNAKFKALVYQDDAIPEDFRSRALTEDLPRYMWRVHAASEGQQLFDLLFDATDLLQGGHVTGGIPYWGDICLALASMARNGDTFGHIAKSASNRVLSMAAKWFADNATSFG
jgi:hypothetical protein